MINYLKAEILKQKHSFNNTIIWLIPIVNIIIALVLMGTKYIQTASYNWWYMIFLPFTVTYISASIIKKDKKNNFHGMLGLVQDKKHLWYAKIGMATLYLFLTSFIFSSFTLLCGFLFNKQIPDINNVFASITLCITFAWQIPFFMFITLHMNMFISVILSMVSNLLFASICAVGKFWWIPFSIPARIMCPIIKVLPNGLLLPSGSILNRSNVIFPGIAITVVLYLIGSLFTANIFKHQEV